MVTRDAGGAIASLTYRIGRQPGAGGGGGGDGQTGSETPGPSPAMALADVLAAALAGGPARWPLAPRPLPAAAGGLISAATQTCLPGVLVVGASGGGSCLSSWASFPSLGHLVLYNTPLIAGSGKTTLLRAMAQAAAQHKNKAVVVGGREE